MCIRDRIEAVIKVWFHDEEIKKKSATHLSNRCRNVSLTSLRTKDISATSYFSKCTCVILFVNKVAFYGKTYEFRLICTVL